MLYAHCTDGWVSFLQTKMDRDKTLSILIRFCLIQIRQHLYAPFKSIENTHVSLIQNDLLVF